MQFSDDVALNQESSKQMAGQKDQRVKIVRLKRGGEGHVAGSKW